jgi:hypothetical protein
MKGTLSQKRSGYFTFCPFRLCPDHVCGFRCEFEAAAFFSMPLPARHPTTWTATCPVDFQQRIFEAAQEPTESFDSPFSLVQVWNVE